MLFSEFQQNTTTTYSCFVSYLELYNERGYDLLSEKNDSKADETTKVTMMEDEDGNYHFRNLSIRPVASEEEALNYLFLGDTNRAIGETDMNLSSSRSHCIFTLAIEGRRVGSDSVTRSKLNLVDLAGSERVHKTNSSGQTLREAQYINTSLFYLEMVIVALAEKEKKERTFVPYRNSMMTSVLRDSLGGNCKTAMIATISPETNQTDESISTCGFAQRVALVKNSARVNEDIEPELIIRRLRSEVARQREEIKFLKGENGEEESISKLQREELTLAVRAYIEDKDPGSCLQIGTISLIKISTVNSIFKDFFFESKEGKGTGEDHKLEDLEKTILSLKKNLQQRDAEVAILVNMVKQGRSGTGLTSSKDQLSIKDSGEKKSQGGTSLSKKQKDSLDFQSGSLRFVCEVERCRDVKVLSDPAVAFSWFRQRCPSSKIIDENKIVLQNKFNQAKKLASQVQNVRSKINYTKSTIEQLRRERAMENISTECFESKSDDMCHEEIDLRKSIENDKTIYKESFQQLRELKGNIEHIQKLMGKSRGKLQSDFDIWYREMNGERQNSIGAYARLSQDTVKITNGQGKEEIIERIKPQKEHNDVGSSRVNTLPLGVTLTGNDDADADIIAFYKAKEALLAARGAKCNAK